MAIRDRIIRALGGVPKGMHRIEPRMEGNSMTVGLLNDPEIAEFLRGGVGGEVVTADHAMRIAVAWRCVNIIAGLMGSYPRDLMRRVDERTRVPAVGEPLRDVLTRKPNRWQKPIGFYSMMQAHLLLRGRCAALKVKSGNRLLALNPLNPDRLTTTQLADNTLQHSYRLLDGRTTTLAQDEVFYMIGLSFDGINGLSVLSYARQAMGLSIETEKAATSLMKNGSFIGGALEHPAHLSDEAYDRLQASLQEKEGSESVGKRLILEEGMKVSQQMGFSAEDLEFLGLRDFSRSEVGMFFGVPPHLYGDTSKATSWGTGIEQQNIGFLQYTMQPWITNWEESIATDLIGDSDPSLYAHFDVKGMLRTDTKTQYECYAIALGSGGGQGFMTGNEVRGKIDMEPSKDPSADRIPGPQAKDTTNAPRPA